MHDHVYIHIHIYIYIYMHTHAHVIHMCMYVMILITNITFIILRELAEGRAKLGRRYLPSATCLLRPQLCYACFVVSRITIICCMIRHVRRPPALDK